MIIGLRERILNDIIKTKKIRNCFDIDDINVYNLIEKRNKVMNIKMIEYI